MSLVRQCDGSQNGPCPENEADQSQPNDRASLLMIRTLDDVKEASNSEDFVEIFITSLARIFQYGVGDIRDCLLQLQTNSLVDLHRALCDNCVLLFPQYKDDRPINRQSNRTIVPDIISLGSSLLNKLPTKELDKIFKHSAKPSSSQEVSSDPEDESDLLKQIIDNRERISKLERLVKSLSTLVTRLGGSVNGEQEIIFPVSTETLSAETDNVAGDRRASLIPDVVEEPSVQAVRPNSESSNGVHPSDSESDSEAENTEVISDFIIPARARKAASRKRRREEIREQEKAFETLLAKEREAAAAASTIKAAVPQSVVTKAVYIGGVDPANNANDIKQHLIGLGVRSVRGIRQLSNNSKSKSFKVDVLADEFDCVCSSGHWPSGVVVRPFLAKKKSAPERKPIVGVWEPRRKDFRRRNGQIHNRNNRRPFYNDRPSRRRNENWYERAWNNRWNDNQHESRPWYGHYEWDDAYEHESLGRLRHWETGSPVRGSGDVWVSDWE